MSEKSRFKDFDAAVEESAKEAIEVKIAGRNYGFPPELPAKVVLGQLRYMDETGNLSAAQIPDWLATLIGQESLDQMMEDGASWEQLQGLLNFLLQEYGISNQDLEAIDDTTGDEESPK